MSSQMLNVSALLYSAKSNSCQTRFNMFPSMVFTAAKCDLAIHAHFGGVVVCRHCL